MFSAKLSGLSGNAAITGCEGAGMRAIICGTLLALTVTAATAAENTHSADYLLPYCKLTADQVADNPSNSYLVGRCAGLVEGVINMSGLLKAMQTVGDIQHLDPLLCAAVPEQVTIEQAISSCWASGVLLGPMPSCLPTANNVGFR